MNAIETIVTQVEAQVVELGSATTLTLGGGSGGRETRNEPWGGLM